MEFIYAIFNFRQLVASLNHPHITEKSLREERLACTVNGGATNKLSKFR